MISVIDGHVHNIGIGVLYYRLKTGFSAASLSNVDLLMKFGRDLLLHARTTVAGPI